MTKIEFEERNPLGRPRVYNIKVNDILDTDSFCYKDKTLYSAYIKDKDIFHTLCSMSFQEVKPFLSMFNSSTSQGEGIERKFVSIYANEYLGAVFPGILVEFDFILEEWNNLYSVLQLREEFISVINLEGDDRLSIYQRKNEKLQNFGIAYRSDYNSIIGDDLDRLLILTNTLLSKANNNLLAKVDHDVLTTFFTFPPAIKTSCKQYLVYFAQFLMDVGIEAETEFEEKVNSTLFRIIPKQKGEALEQIQEALNIYLNAPGSPDFEPQASSNTDISVLQWQANISHLTGQLTLAKAVMQANDATIQSLQLTNYQLQSLVVHHSKDDEEELVKNLVSVKKTSFKGLEFNLPEILRRLKRKLK